jgi:hypothetical protein
MEMVAQLAKEQELELAKEQELELGLKQEPLNASRRMR